MLVVCSISEDVILGMPFLIGHHCTTTLTLPVLLADGKDLMNSVQVTHQVVILPKTTTTLHCRITAQNFSPLRLVEGHAEGLPIATSVNQPQSKGQMVARYLNPTGQHLTLRAGSTIIWNLYCRGNRASTGPTTGNCPHSLSDP